MARKPVPLLQPGDPRHGGAVIEPQREIEPHGDLAAASLDDAHDRGMPVAAVMKSISATLPSCSLEFGSRISVPGR